MLFMVLWLTHLYFICRARAYLSWAKTLLWGRSFNVLISFRVQAQMLMFTLSVFSKINWWFVSINFYMVKPTAYLMKLLVLSFPWSSIKFLEEIMGLFESTVPFVTGLVRYSYALKILYGYMEMLRVGKSLLFYFWQSYSLW